VFATGDTRLWDFAGGTFADAGDGRRIVHAVARNGEGIVYAVWSEPDESTMLVTRLIAGETLRSSFDARVPLPGAASRALFARFSPSGELWIGLEYRDRRNEWVPHGVALVNLGLGVVAFHRASSDTQDVKLGILPVPVATKAVAFCGDNTWLASTEGVARITGAGFELHSESTGLRNELLRGVVCDGGTPLISTRSGVGVFSQGEWTYPAPLALPVEAMVTSLGGALWILSGRRLLAGNTGGLLPVPEASAAWPGGIDRVAIDHLGRLWLLANGVLGLLSP